MRELRDARDLVSLGDEPCRYPDPRPAAQRGPYLYHRGLFYDVQPRREEVASLDQLPVDLGAQIVPLAEALARVNGAPLAERIPVLAVGSNGYPRQLFDKFEQDPVSDDSVVVLGCSVRGMRIAYCAGFSVGKGYVPVTLSPGPAAETHTWLQWLTAEQLAAVARSEGPRYRLVECGSDATGASAVALHGVAEGPRLVYGWCYDARLVWPSDDTAPHLLFSGNPPEGFSGEVEGLSQMTVLQEAVQRALTVRGETLTWDGCRLPEGLRRDLRELLQSYGQPLHLPVWWSIVDRDTEGFPEDLVGR